MNTLKKSLPFIAILLTFLTAGCSKNDNINNPMQSIQQAMVTEPADNSTEVRLDKNIQLIFAKPADRFTVEKNFHLINEKTMLDSLCIWGNSMHDNMSSVMMDLSMMNHFVSNHSTRGSFNWNSDFTQCTFTADSLLQSNTRYMMHFGEEMVDMMDENRINMMEGSGMGIGEMQGHMMWHFTTIDSTDPGTGHEEHH